MNVKFSFFCWGSSARCISDAFILKIWSSGCAKRCIWLSGRVCLSVTIQQLFHPNVRASAFIIVAIPCTQNRFFMVCTIVCAKYDHCKATVRYVFILRLATLGGSNAVSRALYAREERKKRIWHHFRRFAFCLSCFYRFLVAVSIRRNTEPDTDLSFFFPRSVLKYAFIQQWKRVSPERLSKVFLKWLGVQKRWLAKEMACRVSCVDTFKFELKSDLKMRKLAKYWFIFPAAFFFYIA